MNDSIDKLKNLQKAWNKEIIKAPTSKLAKGKSIEELNTLRDTFSGLDNNVDKLLTNTILALEKMDKKMKETDEKIEESIRKFQ